MDKINSYPKKVTFSKIRLNNYYSTFGKLNLNPVYIKIIITLFELKIDQM